MEMAMHLHSSRRAGAGFADGLQACVRTDDSMKQRIQQIVKENAGLGANYESIDYSTDLYRAGMTSYASVVLMIALENEFDLEFPDGMLSRSVFESIDTIANAIESVQQVKQ
jgi:acyl carrier protein